MLLKVKKPFVTRQGLTVPELYWIIGGFSMDTMSSSGSITFVGYATQEALDKKMQPVYRKIIRVDGDDFKALHTKYLPALGKDLYDLVIKKEALTDFEVIA